MYVLKLPRGQLLYSVWLIIDRLPSHRHRHGDNLPVIRRHLPRLIRARKESNPQRGQRGEPSPQQLGHDPHLCSHERWDTDKECCFFMNSLSCRPQGLMMNTCVHVCAFSKRAQLFCRPFIFLLVFVCVRLRVRNHSPLYCSSQLFLSPHVLACH